MPDFRTSIALAGILLSALAGQAKRGAPLATT